MRRILEATLSAASKLGLLVHELALTLRRVRALFVTSAKN